MIDLHADLVLELLLAELAALLEPALITALETLLPDLVTLGSSTSMLSIFVVVDPYPLAAPRKLPTKWPNRGRFINFLGQTEQVLLVLPIRTPRVDESRTHTISSSSKSARAPFRIPLQSPCPPGKQITTRDARHATDHLMVLGTELNNDVIL